MKELKKQAAEVDDNDVLALESEENTSSMTLGQDNLLYIVQVSGTTVHGKAIFVAKP